MKQLFAIYERQLLHDFFSFGQRRKTLGAIPAFDQDILALAADYGKLGKDGNDYLATLTDEGSDASPGSSIVHRLRF